MLGGRRDALDLGVGTGASYWDSATLAFPMLRNGKR